LFDYGVAGYKEYIDSNGAIKIRTINPRNIIINHCKKNDFSDASYVGEVIEMTISDLKQMAGDQFTAEEYENIAKNVLGKYGNPREWPSSLSIYNKGYDRFNIRVLDMESSPLMKWCMSTESTGVEIRYTLDPNTKTETSAKISLSVLPIK